MARGPGSPHGEPGPRCHSLPERGMAPSVAIGSLIAAASIAGGVAVASARRDYESDEELSSLTQALMWPAYALGATVISANIADSRHRGTPLSRLTGGILTTLGAALFVTGARPFRSFSQLAGRERGDLITDGVYRYSRNPQYLGNILITTGAAVADRSLPGCLFAAGVACGYSWYLPAEEAHLQRTFGTRYSKYRSRTPRWFGWKVDTDERNHGYDQGAQRLASP